MKLFVCDSTFSYDVFCNAEGRVSENVPYMSSTRSLIKSFYNLCLIYVYSFHKRYQKHILLVLYYDILTLAVSFQFSVLNVIKPYKKWMLNVE